MNETGEKGGQECRRDRKKKKKAPKKKAKKKIKNPHRDDDVARRVCRHERVPVPVPSHPAPEPEQRPVERQPRLPDLRQRRVDPPVEERERRRDGRVEVRQALPHLGLRRRLLAADLVRAPRALHLRLDVLEALEALVGRHARVVQPVHVPADRAVFFKQGLAQGLRRVRGEDERDFLFAECLVDEVRARAVGRDELLEGAVGGAGGLLDLCCLLFGLFFFVFVRKSSEEVREEEENGVEGVERERASERASGGEGSLFFLLVRGRLESVMPSLHPSLSLSLSPSSAPPFNSSPLPS